MSIEMKFATVRSNGERLADKEVNIIECALDNMIEEMSDLKISEAKRPNPDWEMLESVIEKLIYAKLVKDALVKGAKR